MQKIFLFIGFIFSASFLNAQTFTGTGGAIPPGPNNNFTCFPATVTGVGNINDVNNGLASICINVTHPDLEDLEIILKAPDGTTVPLTVQNGGNGNNYTNTCFTATAATSVKFGTAPFSGSFLPEGYLGAVNNGQNADAAWDLCIADRRDGGSAGTLVSWSITFNTTPAPQPPAFPACANTLPATSSCATATAVCDFNGLCGSTSVNNSTTWTGSGLTSCFGLQNISFIQFIASAATATFTVWVPTNTGGATGGIQMLFFSGTCGSGAVTTHGCYPHIFPYQSSIPLATIITATGLTPGGTYYLMFDGYNNDVSTFRIAANSGVNFLNVTPSDPSICEGRSVNITATGSDGTYTWTPALGLNTTTGPVVTASPAATSTYTVSTTTTSGCNLTKDVTVTVNAPPVITTHPSTDTQRVCQNAVVPAFSVAATPGSGTISGYQWYITTLPNNTGGSMLPFATSSTFSPSTSSTGTLYFYCRVTNSNGCVDTSNISAPLIISPSVNTPTASATVQPTCLAPTGTIVVTAPAGANIRYSIGGAYQASGTFTGLAPDSSYSVTAQNIVTGCISNIRLVPINALPAGPATPVASVTVPPTCLAPTGTVVITSPVGAGIEYSIGGAYQANPSFSGLTNSTTYNITARDNVTGCVSDTLQLTVDAIPGAPAQPTASVTTQPDCNTTTGTITITAPVGATIEYSIGGAYQGGGTFTGLTPGVTYTVTAKNNSSGCVSAPLLLTIDPIASVTAPVVSSPVSYCQNSTATPLTATGTNLLWYTTSSDIIVGASTFGESLSGGFSNLNILVNKPSGTVRGDLLVAQVVCNGGTGEGVGITTLLGWTLIRKGNPSTNSPYMGTYYRIAGDFEPADYTWAVQGSSSAVANITRVTGVDTANPVSTSSEQYNNTSSTIATGSTVTPPSANSTLLFYVGQISNGTVSGYAVTTNNPSWSEQFDNFGIATGAVAGAMASASRPETTASGTATATLAVASRSDIHVIVLKPAAASSTAPTPSTAIAGNFDYYVSQTIGVCESPRALITVTVTSQPPPPAVTSPVTYCQNEATTSLTAAGTSLLWYTVASGGTGSATAPVPLSITTGNSIYYVSQTVNTCESPRAAITVTINATPAAPAVTSTISYCENETAAALTATGSNLLWYNSLTGGIGTSIAPVPATTATGSTVYYVSQTINSCEGPRAAITVTVNAIPTAPSVSSPVNYCENATAVALTATGSNLLWYTTISGGVGTSAAPVPSTTATGNTIFYVSQTTNGCEGPRAAITVTVSAAPAAPAVISPVTYCQAVTSNALSATGTNLLWYTTISGGTGSASAPTPSTANTGNTIYYVSQTINSCEGPRSSITVTINPTPVAPVASTPVVYCENATATALTATGSGLLWYTTVTGGVGTATAPVPATSISGNTLYYVSQTTNSCEGPRAAITVTVNATPSLPTVTSPVPYCQNATAAALTATGSNLLWYTTLTGGTGTATTPIPSTTATGVTNYYVSQTVSGCEGTRAIITVTVGATPSAPVAATPLTYCQNITAPALTATGTNLSWYTTASGGVGSPVAPVPSTLNAGNTFYYVSQATNGCEGPRTAVQVTINATPALPSFTSPLFYCQNDAATALAASGTGLLWYTVASGGTGSSTPPVPATATAGTTIYYVSQTINGCEGPRGAISVTINATPALPTVTSPVTYCQDATAAALTAGGSNLLWYNTATGGAGSATAPTPSTATTGNIVYYVSQSINNCEGPRAGITVTVIATPPPTVISPVTYCQNLVSAPLSAIGTNLLWYAAATGGTGSSVAPIPATATPGNTFYYVTQTLNGCESPRRAITVTINAVSTAVSGFRFSPDTVCINSNNPGPAYDLGFTNGGTFTATPAGLSINPATGNINLAASTIGSYNVTYTYNTTGCVNGSSSSSPLTLLPAVPTVTVFSYTSPVCKNSPDPGPNMATGFTSGGSFTAAQGLAINSATGIIDVANSTPGTYQVTYNITALGCRLGTSNFSFITIIDTTAPVTSFNYSPANVCISSAANPTLERPADFTPGGTFSATPAGLSINSTTGNINIGLSVPGVYTIIYTVPSFICRLAGSDTSTFTITAYANPITGFSYVGPVCKGDGAAIPVTVTGFFNGGSFSSTTGLAIDTASGVIDLTQSIAGNYVIQYDVAQGVCNPAGSGSAPINILSQPMPPTVSAASICGPGIVTLSAAALGTVSWYTEPGLVNQINVGNTYTTLLSSSTPYYITNTVGSCESEATILNATVSPIPAAPFLGNDTAICSTDKLLLNASGPYTGYLWQDGTRQPTISVSNSGTYTVVVSTGTGCETSSSIQINVLDNCDDVHFPTGFSPNGDGLNDKFGPLGNLFLLKNYTLKIFNRYGEIVFTSNNPYEKWDGSFRGKQSGTVNYVWVAAYIFNNRAAKTQKGNLTIVQ